MTTLDPSSDTIIRLTSRHRNSVDIGDRYQRHAPILHQGRVDHRGPGVSGGGSARLHGADGERSGPGRE